MMNGCRVVTPGPAARTRIGAGALPPLLATVTRITWHGPWPVATNNGVDSARTIRMTSSSHAAGTRPTRRGARAATVVWRQPGFRRTPAARSSTVTPSAPAGTRVTSAGSW